MRAEDQRARVLPDRIGPDDPRYSALVGRGFNKRFAGKPDYVRLVHSADGSTEFEVTLPQSELSATKAMTTEQIAIPTPLETLPFATPRLPGPFFWRAM